LIVTWSQNGEAPDNLRVIEAASVGVVLSQMLTKVVDTNGFATRMALVLVFLVVATEAADLVPDLWVERLPLRVETYESKPALVDADEIFLADGVKPADDVLD
jgi:hypothetical protein